MLRTSIRPSSVETGGSSGCASARMALPNVVSSSICASVTDGRSSSSTCIEVLLHLLDADLPSRSGVIRLETKCRIDAEHRRVRVGVARAYIDDVRALSQDAFDVDCLQPLAEREAAVFWTNASPALVHRLRLGF